MWFRQGFVGFREPTDAKSWYLDDFRPGIWDRCVQATSQNRTSRTSCNRSTPHADRIALTETSALWHTDGPNGREARPGTHLLYR